MKHLTNMTVLIFLVLHVKLFSHCQVPCGIYDDAARIIQIKEDFETIKKAMFNIKDLSKKENALSLNQLSRWVSTKESHATDIQNRINHYFLIHL